jgi:DNA topoisomerase IB
VTWKYDPAELRNWHGRWTSAGWHKPAPGELEAIQKKHGARAVPPKAYWASAVVRNDDNTNTTAHTKWMTRVGKANMGYSDEHNAAQKAVKFSRTGNLTKEKIAPLIKALPKDSVENDSAAAVAVMLHTGMRVSSQDGIVERRVNDPSMETFGATTIQRRHVSVKTVRGKKVATFDYVPHKAKKDKVTGKPAVLHMETIDPVVVKAVETRLAKGGEAKSQLFPNASSNSTGAYIKKLVGPDTKNHDLRTRFASVRAQELVNKLPPSERPKTPAEFNAAENKVIAHVATLLGDTTKVTREAYVDPAVFSPWATSAGVVSKRSNDVKKDDDHERVSSHGPDESASGPRINGRSGKNRGRTLVSMGASGQRQGQEKSQKVNKEEPTGRDLHLPRPVGVVDPRDLKKMKLKVKRQRMVDEVVKQVIAKYDTSPLGNGKNWVTRKGGLPLFVRAVAHALMRNGHSKSEAIAIAISQAKKGTGGAWGHKKDGTPGKASGKTQAKSGAAIARWDAMKGSSTSKSAPDQSAPDQSAPDETEFEFETRATICKVDEDKQMFFGWSYVTHDEAGELNVDKSGEFIDDPNEMEDMAYTFVLDSRSGGHNHERNGAGHVAKSTMVESMVFTPEKMTALGIPEGTLPVGWWTGWKTHDAELWDEIKTGKATNMSIHGSGLKKSV